MKSRGLISPIILFLALVAVILLVLFVPRPGQSKTHPLKTILLNHRTIQLEVVTSTADITLGLGNRASMPADRGMLFLFDHAGPYQFWMKGMHFPLDIIWLNHGTVVDISANMPPPSSTTIIPAVHDPVAYADQVVELNAGLAAKDNLQIGSVIPELAR